MFDYLFQMFGFDSILAQQVAWVMSKPAFWLVLLKWCLVAVGVIWLAKNLAQAKRWIWFAVFLCAVAIGIWGMIELTQNAARGFAEGRGNAFMVLRVIGWLTDGVAIWIVFRMFKRRVALDKSFNDQETP